MLVCAAAFAEAEAAAAASIVEDSVLASTTARLAVALTPAGHPASVDLHPRAESFAVRCHTWQARHLHLGRFEDVAFLRGPRVACPVASDPDSGLEVHRASKTLIDNLGNLF